MITLYIAMVLLQLTNYLGMCPLIVSKKIVYIGSFFETSLCGGNGDLSNVPLTDVN